MFRVGENFGNAELNIRNWLFLIGILNKKISKFKSRDFFVKQYIFYFQQSQSTQAPFSSLTVHHLNPCPDTVLPQDATAVLHHVLQ